MKKSLVFWILTGSLLAFAAVKACYFMLDTDELRVVFFPPELGAKPGMDFFYFTPHAIGIDYDGTNKDIDTNIAEWKAWTGRNISTKDIDSVIYGENNGELYLYYEDIISGRKYRNNPLYKTNEFIRFLSNDKRNHEAIEYLVFAKEIEFERFCMPDPWKRDRKDSVRILQQEVFKEGLAKYKKCKSDFLKLRYGFQLTRLAAYAESPDSTEMFYKEFVEKSTVNSVIKYWAMEYYANMNGDNNEAAYRLSLIYDHAPGKKVKAFRNFGYLTRNGVSDTLLNFCKNNHEKAVVYAMAGMSRYKASGLEYLQKAATLDPSAQDMFEVILLREVNKAEDEIMTSSIYSYPASYNPWANYGYDSVITLYSYDPHRTENTDLRKLINFAAAYAGTKDVSHPALWFLAASYLSVLDKQYTEAHKYSILASKCITDGLNNEMHLVNTLISLNESPRIDDAFEKNIYPDLKWMLQDTGVSRQNVYNVFRLLGQKYMAQKDVAKGLLCFARFDVLKPDSREKNVEEYDGDLKESMKLDFDFLLDYDATADDLVKLNNFIDKANKNPLEKMLENTFPVTKPALYKQMGMHFMREIDFANAYKYFKLSNDTSVYHWTGDVFSSKDAYSMDSDQFETKYYLEIEYKPEIFAKKMMELEQLMVSDPKNKAKYYYQYANALYNITYWGSSWNYIRSDRSTNGPYIYSENKKRKKYYSFQDNYYLCTRAIEYYKKAWAAAPDMEFAAECVYQLAKCEQKQYYVRNVDAYFNKQSWQNPYFDILKKRYRKTKYCELASFDCSYFRDFLKAR